MAKISRLKKSPVKPGVYPVYLRDIEEKNDVKTNYGYSDTFTYHFEVLGRNTKDGFEHYKDGSRDRVKFSCKLYANGRDFNNLCDNLFQIFGDEFDTDDHIGGTYLATIDVKTSAAGHEYPVLVKYEPAGLDPMTNRFRLDSEADDEFIKEIDKMFNEAGNEEPDIDYNDLPDECIVMSRY